MIYLPSKISRSAGNIVTGTQFVDTRGNNPGFLYHLAKSANIPLILAGLFAMLLLISEGTEWTNGNKIFVGISLTLLLVPLLDRFLRKRGDEKLGFWDRLFGGVWLVTAEKAQTDSGIIQRLQSIGDYAEQRGMLSENDDKTD
jgi:thiol:disulfide interchange protein